MPEIEADSDKTMWVLNNFLTNAIKYSSNNSYVEIKAEQQNGNVVFSVQYVPGLFERYFQVPGSKEKAQD